MDVAILVANLVILHVHAQILDFSLAPPWVLVAGLLCLAEALEVASVEASLGLFVQPPVTNVVDQITTLATVKPRL